MDLQSLTNDVADLLSLIDREEPPFRNYRRGVGPCGEPQLVKQIAKRLNGQHPDWGAITRRSPDLLIPGRWALEFKIVRPFGDNGREAENWSVNLLHPYEGNVSAIGDALKLVRLSGEEKKAVLVIRYEHTPAKIPIARLLRAFEVVARESFGINLGQRIQALRTGLIHPVHQQVVVASWEVFDLC